MRRLLIQGLLKLSAILRWLARPIDAAAAALCDVQILVESNRKMWDAAKLFREPRMVHSGLVSHETSFLERLTSGCAVGVIGCGGGRELLALADRGFVVEGVDFSQPAVDAARENLRKAGIEAAVHCADAADFVFPGESYRAFIFSWYTYGNIPESSRRIQALRNLGRKLADEGHILISYMNREADPIKTPTLDAVRTLSRWLGGTANFERGDSVGQGLVFNRAFTKNEIVREAEAAGFVVNEFGKGADDFEDGYFVVLRSAASSELQSAAAQKPAAFGR